MTPETATESEPIFTIRQTNLRMLEEQCPAGAWAKAMQKRDTPSGEGAQRGTAVHEVFARYVGHLYETKRATDFEAIEDIAAGVLAESPNLTFTQRKDVMSQARNIADGYLMVPSHYVGSEESLYIDLPLAQGATVRITGTLDLLEIDDEGVATITDAKSNHMIPPDSAVQTDLQLQIYATLVMGNYPQVEAVRGKLWMTRYNIMAPQKEEAIWSREEIDEYREHLSTRLGAFLRGELQHDFIPGTWCQYCPRKRPGDCTLYRSYYGATPPPPKDLQQVVKLARQVMIMEQAREERLALIKAWVNEEGGFQVGGGNKAEWFGFHVSESEEIPAADFLRILGEHHDLVGDILQTPDANRLLSVTNGTAQRAPKIAKQIRNHPDLKTYFDDVAIPKKKSAFGHKAMVEDDE
jgi:RecB family exonuclease